jgi:anhydro-N-acetylmuramic acid kinase
LISRKKASGTLQLGHPETIAEKSRLITIADFRQSDIASGGEGAPITSYAMWLLFGGNKASRLLVNIGGIANYFLFPKNKSVAKMLAKDCGPGNSLLDLATFKYFGKKYDRSGKLASKGIISKRLLSIIMADDFLKGKLGPSTGRERFGEMFLKQVERSASKIKLNKYDIMASLTELTVLGITKSILPLKRKYKINEIDLFGGGYNNSFLVKRLKENISHAVFFSVDRYNINPDYLEAVCYAIMGAMTLHSIPAGLPFVTGAEGRAICGRIIQPSLKGK